MGYTAKKGDSQERPRAAGSERMDGERGGDANHDDECTITRRSARCANTSRARTADKAQTSPRLDPDATVQTIANMKTKCGWACPPTGRADGEFEDRGHLAPIAARTGTWRSILGVWPGSRPPCLLAC